jgi:predicted GIY-YIG superfamily endonuclease
MLRCSDGSFYVGITDDVDERLGEHNRGKGPEYTAKRRPVKLVWHQKYASQQEARKREEEIKGWSRRKKLELIRRGMRPSPR